MEFYTSSQPSQWRTLVTQPCTPVTSTSGVELQPAFAPQTPSTAASVTLLPLATLSTPSSLPVFAPQTSSPLNTERLKSRLSYPRVTGSGPPFGCFRLTKPTVAGPPPARSILWSLAVTTPLARLVATTNSALPSIGVPHGTLMATSRPPSSIPTPHPLQMTSTSTASFGPRTALPLTSTPHPTLFSMLTLRTRPSGRKAAGPNVTTLGNTRLISTHLSTKSSTSS